MDRRSQLDEEDAEAGAAGAEGGSGRSGRQATDIKSNNPHLAGGEKVRRSATTDLMKSQSLFPVRDHWDSPLLEPSQAPNHRPSFIFFLDMRVLSSMLLLYSVLFGMMIEVSRFCFLRPKPLKAADICAYLHIISHIISHEVPTMWPPSYKMVYKPHYSYKYHKP